MFSLGFRLLKIMKIIIPGGSGHVGTLLAKSFHSRGDEVVVLSRSPQPRPWKTLFWDGLHPGEWCGEIDGADVVINLAGRSVNCRYGSHNRRLIMDSRVQATEAVARSISEAARPPRAWLQMSTATIYAHRFDAPNDEDTGLLGGTEPDVPETWNFSIDVAQAWEKAALACSLPKTRRVLLRTAIVMAPDKGGPFHILSNLARFGLGGQAGGGQQYVSWIHGADFVAAVDWLIAREHIEGTVNLASPSPLPNRAFMQAIREALHMPLGLPAPALLLEIGAFFLRTETELILKSRRVIPGKLLESGFTFQYADWPTAARDLVNQAAPSA